MRRTADARLSGVPASATRPRPPHRRTLTLLAAVVVAIGCAGAAVFAATSGHTRTTIQNVPNNNGPGPTTPTPGGGDPGQSTPPTGSTDGGSSTTPGNDGSSSTTPGSDGSGTLAPSATTDDDSTIQAAAQSKIADFHQAVASGDTNTAWQELAPYNRANKISEPGYGDGTQDSPPQQWVTDMGTFNGNLDASNVQVTLLNVDRQSGIALVDVEGMTSSGGGLCNPYSGKTWVAYEDGQWWYDPGVKHHPERSTEFPNQQGLLGIC